jgi:hypothetical protein
MRAMSEGRGLEAEYKNRQHFVLPLQAVKKGFEAEWKKEQHSVLFLRAVREGSRHRKNGQHSVLPLQAVREGLKCRMEKRAAFRLQKERASGVVEKQAAFCLAPGGNERGFEA